MDPATAQDTKDDTSHIIQYMAITYVNKTAVFFKQRNHLYGAHIFGLTVAYNITVKHKKMP